jgi:chromosome segregation ATPase
MIGKVIVGTAAGLLVATLLFGRDVVSYVRTSVGYMTSSVTDSVPMEFQIERARGMIDGLVPEIRKNMHVIAKEEVEVEKLRTQIADAEVNLERDQAELKRLAGDLSTGDEVFHYAGRKYTPAQVKADLANRFERYKVSEATLGSLREICDARERSLDAARQKLEGMLATKRQLEVEVENLDAELQMVAAAQTTAEYNFDDSKLGRVKELIEDLRTRLEVAQRMVNAEGYYQGEIPLDETPPEDIASQVTEYFGLGQPGAKTLAKD